MHGAIVPDSFIHVLTAFEECFHAPSYRNFVALVVGWVHCLGRRTVTAVVLASGTLGQRHISVFHRFFSRAQWAAVRRTAPLALIVSALVLLWYAGQCHDQRMVGWTARPWYRTKTTPSFLDMLTALRRAGWHRYLSQPPCVVRLQQNPGSSWHETLLATA